MTVMLNAQVQYRGNDTQSLNVFPGLGGTSKSTNISVPVSVNIAKGRTTNNISVNYTSSNSRSANRFAYNTNAVGLAGITGVATDPSEWGLPNLTFSSGYSSLRDVSPSVRTDKRLTATYTWGRTIGKMRWYSPIESSCSAKDRSSRSVPRASFTTNRSIASWRIISGRRIFCQANWWLKRCRMFADTDSMRRLFSAFGPKVCGWTATVRDGFPVRSFVRNGAALS